jgi:hypothetical protein
MISVINEIIKAMLPDKKKFHAPRSWAIRCWWFGPGKD